MLRICIYRIYIRIYFLTGDACNNMEISNDSPAARTQGTNTDSQELMGFPPDFMGFYNQHWIISSTTVRFLVQD